MTASSGSRKSLIIKIHMIGAWSTQVPVTESSAAKDLCKKVGEKHMSSSSGNVKLQLYLAMYRTDKKPLEEQVLRKLRDEENVYELEKQLSEKKIPHEYHALSEELYKVEEEELKAKYNENFFKKRKWERSGELRKLSSKQQKFLKRSFYLGTDSLYCINKASKNCSNP